MIEGLVAVIPSTGTHCHTLSVCFCVSADTSYYVYALKDPRQSPALPFYVGRESVRVRTTTWSSPTRRAKVNASARLKRQDIRSWQFD